MSTGATILRHQILSIVPKFNVSASWKDNVSVKTCLRRAHLATVVIKLTRKLAKCSSSPDSMVSKMMWLVPLLLLMCSTAATTGDAEDVSEAYTHGSSGTTLHSAYNFLKCTTDVHVTPTSTEELSDLVKQLTSSPTPVKIRATRVGFHSGAGFVCSGHRDSTKKKWVHSELHPSSGVQSVSVLLNRMNRVLAVDHDRLQLTIEAGATILDLANAAEANGMSIRAGAYSVYTNLTLGGVLSASAHGSGLGTISSLGMLVRKLKWVNANGEILVSDGVEMNALIGGLGLLGIITEVTLQLEGKSMTIIEAREDLSDANIAGDLIHMLKHETPHVIALWRPDLGTFKVQLYTHVPGENALPADAPPFQATVRNSILMGVNDELAGVLGGLLTAWDDDIADDSAAADALNNGVCSVEDKLNRTPLFTNENGTVITRATASTNYVMTGAECTPKCIWEVHHMKAMAEDMEFTIKLSQLQSWVQDVKSIINSELGEVQDRLDSRYGTGKVKRCLPPGSLWIRFGKGTNGVLATSGGTEDVAFVQWASLVSASATRPGKHAAMIQAVEQLSLCKYKARPHWGKNHERVFRHHECHVRDNFPEEKFDQILELQARHDPNKVFEPELFSHVLRKNGPDYSPQCSLHMWCYCREDAHCPVGFACLPSPAFPEHKVCRVVVAQKHDEL